MIGRLFWTIVACICKGFIDCLADDSHEISRLVFSEKKKKKKYFWMSSATNFAWRLSVKRQEGEVQVVEVGCGKDFIFLFRQFALATFDKFVLVLYWEHAKPSIYFLEELGVKISCEILSYGAEHGMIRPFSSAMAWPLWDYILTCKVDWSF